MLVRTGALVRLQTPICHSLEEHGPSKLLAGEQCLCLCHNMLCLLNAPIQFTVALHDVIHHKALGQVTRVCLQRDIFFLSF